MVIEDLPVRGCVEVCVSPPSEPGKLVYRGELRRRGMNPPVCTKFTQAFDSGRPVTFLLDHPVDYYTITIRASNSGSRSIKCTINATAFAPSGERHGPEVGTSMMVKAGVVGREKTIEISLVTA